MPRLLCALALLAVAGPAVAADPLATVRAFCRADGHGDRLYARSWAHIAHLVTWELEPAWDRVLAVRGYEVQTPRIRGVEVEVEVAYTVTADVQAGKLHRDEHIETRTYRLTPDDAGGWWRIVGPPPPPHVFETDVDLDLVAASLDPDSPDYTSASALVWRFLRGSGLDVPYTDTASLAAAQWLTAAAAPQPGDLVAYLDGGQAYHVGLVESEDQIVSATLNAGVRRAPVAAFAGEGLYLRPLAGRKTASPEPTAPGITATPVATSPTPAH